MHIVVVIALAISLLGHPGAPPSAHHGRCHGVLRPPALGSIGGPWICTKDGWHWVLPPFTR